ncbi:MAG TPA: hypothetical protein VF519_02225 [Mycobacteriales bacterium]|jgi:hypothetical protein
MDDPWGAGERPALVTDEPLPTFAHVPHVTELPEVKALAAGGWYPLGDAPWAAPLPAVWPREHRCWVADRLPRFVVGGGPPKPWDETDAADMAAMHDMVVEQAGLPPGPRGRLWLLRSPWPGLTMLQVLKALEVVTDREGRDRFGAGRAESAREILGWTEEQVREVLPETFR